MAMRNKYIYKYVAYSSILIDTHTPIALFYNLSKHYNVNVWKQNKRKNKLKTVETNHHYNVLQIPGSIPNSNFI